MEIVRVLNNNAAIVTDPSSDQQMVVLGKGIAHGRRRGEEIDPAAVDQTFVPDHVHPVEEDRLDHILPGPERQGIVAERPEVGVEHEAGPARRRLPKHLHDRPSGEAAMARRWTSTWD